MDAERFDVLTRKLSSGQTRRRALGTLGALFALGTQRGRAAQLGPPACGDAGDVCTMLAGCCDGLTCVTSAINTNYGVCVSGGDGGTVASGTSLVSPYSESAQATGTVDSTTTTTTTTGTSTTSTTSPQAERQAKLQERRSRRSTRRNKIQSRRSTKATNRETRRDDAEEAAELAAGPELEFDYFLKEPTTDGPQVQYEELRVTNVSNFAAKLTAVRLYGDTSSGTALTQSISSGSSFGLVSGLTNGDDLDSDQYWWLQEDVCQAPADPALRGWVVKTQFSGETENRSYTIMCDGSVNGVPLTSSDDTTTNNRKKRKRKHKQQAAAKRKKNKQNNKGR